MLKNLNLSKVSLQNRLIVITTAISVLAMIILSCILLSHIKYIEYENILDNSIASNLAIETNLLESESNDIDSDMIWPPHITKLKQSNKACIYDKNYNLLDQKRFNDYGEDCYKKLDSIPNYINYELYKETSYYTDHNITNKHIERIKIYDGDEFLSVISPVAINNKDLFYILLEVSISKAANHIHQTKIYILSVLALLSLLTLIIFIGISKSILSPLNSLRQVAKEFLETKDYSLYSNKFYNDEIGDLSDFLNHIIKTMKQRENELREYKEQSELTRNITNKARIEAQSANEMKNDFLAKMSHELRTPLNSILVLSDLLLTNEKDNFDKEQLLDLKTIYNSGSDLLSLINDILDISKLEAGKMEVTCENINIKELTERINNKFRAMIEKKNINFKVEYSPSIPKNISSDSTKLEQIINNFISNSVKFTSEGSIILKVYKPDSWTIFNNSILSYDNTLAISVTDTGTGITKEMQGTIFLPFEQESNNVSKEFGGTGLGLSICKNYAELLGGEINMVSDKGSGSVFTLYIPYGNNIEEETKDIDTSNDKDIEVEIINDTPDDTLDNKEPKILIVDDEERNIYALSRRLSKENWEILTASNGKESLDVLNENKDIDLVLMDIMMPVMDGYQAIKAIRETEGLKDMPIIAVTAKTMKEDRQKCLDCGANDFVSKPVNVEVLLKSIKKHLRKN